MFKFLRRFGVLTSVSLAVTACNESSQPVVGPSPKVSLSQSTVEAATAELRAAGNGRTLRGIEDEILRLESLIPGLGGLFIDSAGNIVVYGPSNATADAVKAALSQHAHTLKLREEIKTQIAAGNRVIIRPGQFAFSHLVAWQKSIVTGMGPSSGIITVDADEFTNRLRVGVKESSAINTVKDAAARNGIPAEALLVTVETEPQALAGLRGTWRPTGGGVQISLASGGLCSLGYNVATSTGLTGFITAGHCLTAMGTGTTGAIAYQPIPNFSVGTVQINPAWNSTDPGCGSYTLCTWGDVMFVQYTSSSTSNTRVAYTNTAGINNLPGPITVTGWWNNVVDPTGFFLVGGEPMDKVGRTTGWTRGTLAATCINTVVSGPYMVLCANRVDGASAGQGDSGGPVFIPPPTGQVTQPLYPLGILFAGGPLNEVNDEGAAYCDQNCSYFYTPFQNVAQHLGVGVIYN